MARCEHAMLAVLLVISTLVGCSKDPAGTDAKPLLGARGQHLVVRKSALAKIEFLLHSVLIEPDENDGVEDIGSSLKSRIVTFVRRADKVYLLEAPEGHRVSAELPTNLMLAALPIVAEDNETVVLDFGAGMSNIFVAAEYHTPPADTDGVRRYDRRDAFTSRRTRVSYVESIEVGPKSLVSIRQVAQLSTPRFRQQNNRWVSDGEENLPIEVRYYLSPYEPDPSYPKLVAGGSSSFGFFEVAPQLVPGRRRAVVSYAMRFHPEKPIVFAISSNTPAAYRQAIREGVLYWNHALGRNQVSIIDAPAGVTAPHREYNVIQWVTDDDAPAAYADFQSDPRTGQILHAQIYLPSMWVTATKADLRRRIRTALSRSATVRHEGVTLKGFTSHARCRLHELPARELVAFRRLVAKSDVTDEQVLRSSLDQLRLTVAHEVGHTLGFLHNFAGSLAANYPLHEQEAIFKRYVKDRAVAPTFRSTNTVMEYQGLKESVLTGLWLTLGKSLEFDELTAQMLYRGKRVAWDAMPYFCTDAAVSNATGGPGEYLDCEKFDSGSSVVEYSLFKTDHDYRELPYTLLERFHTEVRPAVGVGKPVREVKLSAEDTAWALQEGMRLAFRTFFSDAKLLRVRQKSENENPRPEELKLIEKDFLSFTKIGKLDDAVSKAMERVPAGYADYLKQTIAHELEHGDYEFSDSEKEQIARRLDYFVSALGDEIGKLQVRSLAMNGGQSASDTKSKKPEIVSHPLGMAITRFLEKKATEIAIASTGKQLGVPFNAAGTVGAGAVLGLGRIPALSTVPFTSPTLPEFRYPLANRLEALALLGTRDAPRGENSALEVLSRQRLSKSIEEFGDKALGRSVRSAKVDEFGDSRVATWVIEVQRMLTLVSDTPPPAPAEPLAPLPAPLPAPMLDEGKR